jgi:hypothetical protein
MAELGINIAQLQNLMNTMKFFSFPGAEATSTMHQKKVADLRDDICEVVGIALASIEPIGDDDNLKKSV